MPSLRRPNITLRAFACLAVLTVLVLIPATRARAQGIYQNPFAGDTYEVGRTDMGVDLCLSPGEPIRAIGPGVVIGINRDWFEGEPYLWYELTRGPDAGRYVYVAEQVRLLAHVGQVLSAGQIVARYSARGTCIETGWGAADGWTLAQVTTGYHEGQVTVAGVSFAHFLTSLGVQGTFELHPSAVGARAKPKPKPRAPRKHRRR